MFLETMDDALV